ncbi:MAG: hypothetical protein NVSMB6_12060 [Burkholderiaceae bacterium]
MEDTAAALGGLLITLSDLCDSAEAHGIIGNPPAAVLAPLVREAERLGIVFEVPPSLNELHLAVETAAQKAAGGN